jgi:hypothetical protein
VSSIYFQNISFERSHGQIHSCRVRLGHDCQNPAVLVDAERDYLDLRQGKHSCETSASGRRCLETVSCKAGELMFNLHLRYSEKIACVLVLGQSGERNQGWFLAIQSSHIGCRTLCHDTSSGLDALDQSRCRLPGSTTIMLGFMPHTEPYTERLLSQSDRHSTHASRFS